MKPKLLLLAILFHGFISFAQPGAIDLSFNPSGVGAFGGTLPPSYQPLADGLVYKSALYPSGPYMNRLIIVGRFTSFNGVPRKYVARILANGSIDNTFTSPAFNAGYIYSLKLVDDNKIIVGGVFTISDGATTIRNIARLNSDGSLDTTFNPGTGDRGANNPVHALAIQSDGKILVGGNFTQFNNAASRRLIRLNTDGTIDATFNGTGTTNGEIRTIAIQKIGANADKIVIGGFFSGFTGYVKNKVIRLLPNGDFDTTFNPTGNGATGGDAVFDIVINDLDKIYVGGKFTNYNGQNKRSIVMLDEDGALDPSFNAGGIGVTSVESNAGLGSGYNVFSIMPQPDGEILIGGNFTEFNGITLPKGLARLNPDGTLDTNFLTGTGFTGGTNVYMGKSVVRDIILQSDGKIVVSGDFTDYDGVSRRMIARIKTRQCTSTATYTTYGWDNGILPTNDSFYTTIQSGTYTIPTGTHLSACELHVNAGANLIIEAGASITVKGIVITNGNFNIESSGSLVQTDDRVINSGSGNFRMKRNSEPVTRFDYTYWSSPVVGATCFNVSPNTLLDKYFKYNTLINNWQNIPYGIDVMLGGKGYIIRAPQMFSTTVPDIFTATFVGKPNNGRISPDIIRNGTSWNLIGNPYPSAIDVDLFLGHANNVGVVGGTIYLWTHKTPLSPGGTGYIYSAADYAAYNYTGGVTTQPTGVLPFAGKVASGQAFFVEGLVNGKATFNNSMRIATDNNQFYRANIQKDRFWLNLTNNQGAFNQMLIGYLEGATVGYDRGFDGKVFGGTYVNLYSISDNENLTIQGRPAPFVPSDVIQLGYKTTIAGDFQITLPTFEGLFANQDVFLEDKETTIIHNLKISPYTFSSAIGTFNNRFKLRYSETSLAIPQMISQLDVKVTTYNNSISVLSESNMIKSIVAFDVLGKQIFAKNNLDINQYNIEEIQKNNQLLLLKITMQNDAVVLKKIGF